MMDDNTIKALMAMACITVLEAFAMYTGINGVSMAAAMAALAGLGGFALAKLTGKDSKSETKKV